MAYKKELGIKQRIVNLSKLLMDSKLLGFNPLLVKNYHNQLMGLLVVQKEDKRRDKERRDIFILNTRRSYNDINKATL